AAYQELALHNVETLRRSAERNIRHLRDSVREFAIDAQADLASLRTLRQTAESLLCDGAEVEGFRHFFQVALETSEITNRSAAAAAKASPDLAELRSVIAEADSLCIYFRRLLDRFRIPTPPVSEHVLQSLEALAPVTGSR